MPTCREVMTPDPACCEPDDTISHVAEVMRTEDVGSIPVVESRSSMRLVGIVTDRDIVTKILAGGRDVASSTVRDAMTSTPASCTEDDDLDKAVALMSERQVRRMPIVDDQGAVTGIIAQADVATRTSSDSRTGQLLESISEPMLER